MKNGADTLPQLLDALDSQESRYKRESEIEIIAIDSGSSDGSLELMRERGVRVESIAPDAFNHGDTRNLGIAATTGEIAILLTQDAIPATPTFIDAMADAFSDPGVAGAFGRQIPRADCDVVTRRQLEGWLTGRDKPARAALDGRNLADLAPYDRYALCVFDNVCSAVRRSAWEEMPFPRTDFGEDIGWGKSAIEANFAIAYVPAAAVVHSHRRSIFYEYERARVCHRRLNDLFDLATLPDASDLPRAIFANLRSEIPFVARHAPAGIEQFRQLGRTAGLCVLGPIAQYQGIRDARRARRVR